ncbi:MAG: hypothetical protein DDT34_01364 [Firmicutes bacterium]|nr:hypothetical protein [Bacillota bacterium]
MTWQGFEQMAQCLTAVAARWSKGRMLLCLEGGYHLEGQAQAVAYVLRRLAESPGTAPKELPPALPRKNCPRRRLWQLPSASCGT